MIRRNFFRIAGGALAAMFVPKVAEAVVEKTAPYFDPEDLERAAADTNKSLPLVIKIDGRMLVSNEFGVYEHVGWEWVKLPDGEVSRLADNFWEENGKVLDDGPPTGLSYWINK